MLSIIVLESSVLTLAVGLIQKAPSVILLAACLGFAGTVAFLLSDATDATDATGIYNEKLQAIACANNALSAISTATLLHTMDPTNVLWTAFGICLVSYILSVVNCIHEWTCDASSDVHMLHMLVMSLAFVACLIYTVALTVVLGNAAFASAPIIQTLPTMFLIACVNLGGTIAFLLSDGIYNALFRCCVSANNAICLIGSLVMLQIHSKDVTWATLLVSCVSFILAVTIEVLMSSTTTTTSSPAPTLTLPDANSDNDTDSDADADADNDAGADSNVKEEDEKDDDDDDDAPLMPDLEAPTSDSEDDEFVSLP